MTALESTALGPQKIGAIGVGGNDTVFGGPTISLTMPTRNPAIRWSFAKRFSRV